MTKKTSIESHLSTISSLLNQFVNINIGILNEELVDKVLTSLLTRMFLDNLFCKEKSPTYKELKSMILQEEDICQQNNECDNNKEALTM